MSDKPDLTAAVEKVKAEIGKSRQSNQPAAQEKTVAKQKSTKNNEATEAPKSKKGAKEEAAPAKKEKAEGYTAAQLAEDMDIEPVLLRRALRGIEAEKPEGGRWVWGSKADTKELRAQLKEWLETDARKERKSAGKAEEPAKSKKGKKEEEAAPAKSKKKKSASE